MKIAFTLFSFISLVGLLHETVCKKCPKEPKLPKKPPELSLEDAWDIQQTAESLVTTWQKDHSLKPKRKRRAISPIDKALKAGKNWKLVKSKILRKEYRQMTVKEMNKFHHCLQKLKDSGLYDKIVDLHHPDLALPAHFGSAFLPWHRHYIFVFEQFMRNLDGCSSAFIPYWDPTLDQTLPSPADTVLWTNQFWGDNRGQVTSGKMGKNWNITKDCQGIGKKLLRVVSGYRKQLLSRQTILNVLSAKTYVKLLRFVENLGSFSLFELYHGWLHCYIGSCQPDRCVGHMGCVTCSPNDPVFLVLHGFIDYLWDEWSSLPGRVNTYPIPRGHGTTMDNTGGAYHQKNSRMFPFKSLVNNDGFRKGFYPKYKPRPSLIRCKVDKDCKSPMKLLFCHRCGYCWSTIAEGGSCKSFPDKACYCHQSSKQPVCQNGKCRCLKSRRPKYRFLFM